MICPHGEIALIFQEPIEQIEQFFHRARFRQRLTIEPKGLPITPESQLISEGDMAWG